MASLRVRAGKGAGPSEPHDKSLGGHLGELATLVVAYAKQETVDPLKRLVRFVVWGVAGALLVAVGGSMLTLTAVRVLQTETGRHLHGNLTWVPYAGGIVVAALGAGWSVTRIFKGGER